MRCQSGGTRGGLLRAARRLGPQISPVLDATLIPADTSRAALAPAPPAGPARGALCPGHEVPPRGRAAPPGPGAQAQEVWGRTCPAGGPRRWRRSAPSPAARPVGVHGAGWGSAPPGAQHPRPRGGCTARGRGLVQPARQHRRCHCPLFNGEAAPRALPPPRQGPGSVTARRQPQPRARSPLVPPPLTFRGRDLRAQRGGGGPVPAAGLPRCTPAPPVRPPLPARAGPRRAAPGAGTSTGASTRRRHRRRS